MIHRLVGYLRQDIFLLSLQWMPIEYRRVRHMLEQWAWTQTSSWWLSGIQCTEHPRVKIQTPSTPAHQWYTKAMILIFGILMTFFSAVAFVIEVRSKPRKIYKIVLCLLLFLGSVAVAFFGYSLFILASAP